MILQVNNDIARICNFRYRVRFNQDGGGVLDEKGWSRNALTCAKLIISVNWCCQPAGLEITLGGLLGLPWFSFDHLLTKLRRDGCRCPYTDVIDQELPVIKVKAEFSLMEE